MIRLPFIEAIEEQDDGVGVGNCYWTDSTKSNTWRQLRIINATHNINYVEFEKFQNFDKPSHVELYDINKDRFDMNDVSEQHPAVVTAMRQRLPAFFGCAQNTTVIV